jgi:glycosyltransferase involved in cell wall biosynthesis
VSSEQAVWMMIWDHFGPYHDARIAGLRRWASARVWAVQFASVNATYDWKNSFLERNEEAVLTLQEKLPAEELGFWRAFVSAFRLFRDKRPEVVFCPSYWPARSLAVVLAARLVGAKTVMMNESHAGTEKSGGAGRLVKRALIKFFDAALVGGGPHRRHFTALGMAAERIFTGYDAVDNDHFQREAAAARADKKGTRMALRLPERYILNLGRMVQKKNLPTLVRAFALAKKSGLDDNVHLVLVGSGEKELSLKALCSELELFWNDVSATAGDLPSAEVLFYGFRQIDQNPSFYALADCFVLPSLYEEWGLVVNEAMACGLPVIVSNTAGCAEDLVLDGQNGYAFDPGSEDELAQKLLAIYAESDRIRSMGQESARIIESWGCDGFAKNAIFAAQMALGLSPGGERTGEKFLRDS